MQLATNDDVHRSGRFRPVAVPAGVGTDTVNFSIPGI
jgi:hypothetical protein